MKIAIIIGSLTGGGAEKVAINICEHISKEYLGKIECDLIVLNNTGDYEYNGSIIYLNEIYKKKDILKKAFYHFFYYRYKLKKLKTKNKYDRVISFATLPNILNIKTKSGEKCIISVRNYASLELSERKKKLIAYAYNKADEIVAVSELCKQDLIENFSLDRNKVKVIYNPYNIEKIQKDMLLNVDEDVHLFNKHTLISVGRISPQKAFWRLLKAVSIVKSDIKDIKVVILGRELDGSQNTELLMRIIGKYNLQEHVELIGFKKNPYQYMNLSAAFVLTSKFEGFPNAMTEAMAVGLPVISVNCLSGPKEILANGEYGILIPQYEDGENLEEICEGDRVLAKAIVDLLKSTDKQKYYKEQARLRVNDFKVSKIVSLWLE